MSGSTCFFMYYFFVVVVVDVVDSVGNVGEVFLVPVFEGFDNVVEAGVVLFVCLVDVVGEVVLNTG